jgi:hypothetical protein
MPGQEIPSKSNLFYFKYYHGGSNSVKFLGRVFPCAVQITGYILVPVQKLNVQGSRFTVWNAAVTSFDLNLSLLPFVTLVNPGAVAQLGERLVRYQQARGSIPLSSTNYCISPRVGGIKILEEVLFFIRTHY